MTDADRAEIAHLMRRAGFGARPAELDAAAARGYQACVDALVRPTGADPGVTATPPPALAAVDRKDGKARRAQVGQLQLWWLDRMVRAEHPLAERLTLFWHGHWATSVQKVKVAALMLAQNQTLRRLGQGDFRELARTMVRDPAMLIWLDAGQNRIASPNENLGRELMELFTLGIGNYTDEDVKQAARALTGWRLDRKTGAARFVAAQHDTGAKTILGHTAAFDDRSLVDLLVDTDAGRRFVVRRLWYRLAAPTPPDEATTARLLAAYGPGRDVSALVRALLLEPAFRTAKYALVKEPVVYVVGALRALGVRPSALAEAGQRGLLTALRATGQELFVPPSVGGWPANRGWLATSASQARLDFTQRLAALADLSALERATQPTRVDATARLLAVDAWTARTRRVLDAAAGDPRQLVALALASPEYVVA
jgi:uncharacterized protein (DUF1800 family)